MHYYCASSAVGMSTPEKKNDHSMQKLAVYVKTRSSLYFPLVPNSLIKYKILKYAIVVANI